MRGLALILAAALLGGCAAYSCDLEATREISFTSISERDTAIARSSGDCAAATATLTLISSGGETIYTAELPLAAITNTFRARPTHAEASEALGVWAAIPVSYTALAPPWEALGEATQAGLDRRAYEGARARQWRMICPRISAANEACLYWDESQQRAVPLYERRIAAE